jgi:F-type H+-transporting ATPase subunit a
MHRLFKFLLVLVLVSPIAVSASNHNEDHEHQDDSGLTQEEKDEREKERNAEFVIHHTKDSHDFGFVVDQSEDKHYGFSLPVILYDEGFHFFSSSSFDHGHKIAESDGKFYKIDSHDGKIYKCDEHGTVLTKKIVEKITETIIDPVSGEEKEITREEITYEPLMPLDFSITKNVVVIFLMCIFMFFFFKSIAKSYKSGLAPSGAAKFFEPIILFIRDDIAVPNIGEKQHKKYMVYLLTVFFFIWFLNLAGMTPLGINVTGNLAVTCVLALVTFSITTFTGNKNYWMHIFWMPGVPIPMKIILIPIELIGMVVKPFALMIRLYANMLAGHIVLGMLLVTVYSFHNYFASGAFVGLTFFMNIIELLVALLQAYIFTMLTALYFGSASATAEHH